MLDIFLNVTQANTLPDLKEYYWRNDKVLSLLANVLVVSKPAAHAVAAVCNKRSLIRYSNAPLCKPRNCHHAS